MEIDLLGLTGATPPAIATGRGQNAGTPAAGDPPDVAAESFGEIVSRLMGVVPRPQAAVGDEPIEIDDDVSQEDADEIADAVLALVGVPLLAMDVPVALPPPPVNGQTGAALDGTGEQAAGADSASAVAGQLGQVIRFVARGRSGPEVSDTARALVPPAQPRVEPDASPEPLVDVPSEGAPVEAIPLDGVEPLAREALPVERSVPAEASEVPALAGDQAPRVSRQGARLAALLAQSAGTRPSPPVTPVQAHGNIAAAVVASSPLGTASPVAHAWTIVPTTVATVPNQVADDREAVAQRAELRIATDSTAVPAADPADATATGDSSSSMSREDGRSSERGGLSTLGVARARADVPEFAAAPHVLTIVPPATGGTVAAAVTPTGSVPDGTHAAMGEVPGQVVRAIQMQWRQGVGEARLTLSPESLGEVQIMLKVESGTVTAMVRADNPATMEWLRGHQHELRAALDSQGLSLEQFDVSVNPDDRRQPRDGAADPQSNPRKRRASDASIPQFELVV